MGLADKKHHFSRERQAKGFGLVWNYGRAEVALPGGERIGLANLIRGIGITVVENFWIGPCCWEKIIKNQE